MVACPTQVLLSQVDGKACTPLAADSVLGDSFYGNTVYGLAPLNLLGDELMEALILGPLPKAFAVLEKEPKRVIVPRFFQS